MRNFFGGRYGRTGLGSLLGVAALYAWRNRDSIKSMIGRSNIGKGVTSDEQDFVEHAAGGESTRNLGR